MNYRYLPALLLLTAGCASQVPRLTHSLVWQEPCCSSLADISYVGIERNKEREFSIDQHSQVYEFAEGKSYFVRANLTTFAYLQATDWKL